jgi:hypothetical protein
MLELVLALMLAGADLNDPGIRLQDARPAAVTATAPQASADPGAAATGHAADCGARDGCVGRP